MGESSSVVSMPVTSMTVADIVQALVQQNAAENSVGVSVNGSDPFDVTDISVDINPDTGNKTIVLVAG